MSLASFVKATVICAIIAFLVYSFPIIGQIAIIGSLGLLWSACALQTAQGIRRRWLA